ncbi:uncharacterized protein BO97DRAFT_427216 [Aspergillus homomorphus CBS 101889]|uniref:Uncharacterized protein n=1 Tax=Aspergillus homomorphus (strain CBS 101889) TaxID=1450537 RepID=A0A395HP96_ASPHC|nr:hypothetical protein BO97DRAFT_427216 [Aspergillus homomorphus CBS 101889]RAL09580.1 hypothetical protein BO97DRAFT_427216 [Aspergillus homomorphus CBS 101889]
MQGCSSSPRVIASVASATFSRAAGLPPCKLRGGGPPWHPASWDTRHYIRSFATRITTQQDRSRISYGGDFDPQTDIGSSSWADVQLYRVAFGPLLGKPALVRRPDFAPLKSDIYFMPRTEEGDVDALLCMTEEDFAGLDVDPEWRRYADCIG